MKKLMFVIVLLTASQAFAAPCPQTWTALNYAAPGCALNATGWSWIWPTTSFTHQPDNGGWHRDWYNTNLHAYQTYQECTGQVTFSFCVWTYPYPVSGTVASGTSNETINGVVTAIPNPWILDYTGNDPQGAYSTTSSHALTLAAVNTTDTTITINCSQTNCSGTPSTTTAYFCSSTPSGTPNSSGDTLCRLRLPPSQLFIRVEDEDIGYSDYVNNYPVAGQGTFVGLVHGQRGTTAVNHTSTGLDIWQQSPVPQVYSRRTNTLITPPGGGTGFEPRHPWHDTAVDNSLNCWMIFDGKPESSAFKDTWEYCFGNNTTDPTITKLPLSSTTGDLLTAARTDGTLESASPSYHQLFQYGGGTGPSSTVSLICLDSACVTAMTGWTATLNVWSNFSNSSIHCYGTLWNGSACSNPGVPTARSVSSTVWNDHVKRYIIIGGATNGGSGTCVPTIAGNPTTWDHINCPTEYGMNNIWAFDPVTLTFQQIVVTGDIPAPSRRPSITYNSTDFDVTLWEGPIVYDASANPYVGVYESGIYKLNITTATPLPTTGTINGTWTIQGASYGCAASASTVCPFGPPLEYSQSSKNSSKQGCSNGNSPWPNDGITVANYICDHAAANIVHDSDHNAYWFSDIDTSTSTTIGVNFTLWVIPATSIVASSSPNPPSPAPVLSIQTPNGIGNGQVSLTWTSSNGATAYQVFKCTGGNVTCGTPPATTYPTNYSSAAVATQSLSQTVTGLTNGTTYWFVVVASNNVPPAAVSGSVTATPVAGGDVTPSSTQLNFATQPINTTSAAQLLTLNNSGGASVSVSNFTITGNFAFSAGATNPCSLTFPFTINAAASCNLNITFTPTQLGTRTGTFTITDTGASSPQSVGLQGTGGSLAPNIIRGNTIRH